MSPGSIPGLVHFTPPRTTEHSADLKPSLQLKLRNLALTSEGRNRDVSALIAKLTKEPRRTPMKSTLKATAIVLLGALGGVNRSLAATAYTNSVLSGCYGFLSHSVGIS